MIKKQILCCSAFFSLLIVAKLAKYDHAEAEQSTKQQQVHFVSTAETNEDEGVKSERLASLHFAQVYLPHDRQVLNKMTRYLDDYSHQNSASRKLYEKALKFLPEVERILVSMGIPEDFKYIPLIESGLTKNTTSIKGASGYWQFIPATARAYGLRVDAEVDERQDLVKSTRAAAKYLKALYREFEDWTLVAAAYNIGDGNLRRAIARQGQDDYFRLKLNRETGSYIYKLIAAKEMIEQPEMYGYAAKKAKNVSKPEPTLYAWESSSFTENLL